MENNLTVCGICEKPLTKDEILNVRLDYYGDEPETECPHCGVLGVLLITK